MDDHTDLYRQAKAAQRRAEQGGFLDTAAALARIADMVADLAAQAVTMDRGVVVPFASALPVGRQVQR